jgi:hypothetical protein
VQSVYETRDPSNALKIHWNLYNPRIGRTVRGRTVRNFLFLCGLFTVARYMNDEQERIRGDAIVV